MKNKRKKINLYFFLMQLIWKTLRREWLTACELLAIAWTHLAAFALFQKSSPRFLWRPLSVFPLFQLFIYFVEILYLSNHIIWEDSCGLHQTDCQFWFGRKGLEIQQCWDSYLCVSRDIIGMVHKIFKNSQRMWDS